VSSLDADDQAVLRAFLTLSKTATASVQAHAIMAEARLPDGPRLSTEQVTRSLAKLRELGYLTTIRTYGPGRRLHPVIGSA
jgi:hypothetical protein